MNTGKMRRTLHGIGVTIRGQLGKFISDGWPKIQEAAFKLAIPIATIIAGYFGHSIQQSMATAQLLVQREQADTQIRAEMFKATTDPLFKRDKGEQLTSAEQAVFAELLALNFHEHIELKPLLLEVDTKLVSEYAASLEEQKLLSGGGRARTLASQIKSRQIDERVQELRSVARRVRSRQTSMLVEELSAQKPASPTGRVGGNWMSFSLAVAEADQRRGVVRYIGVRRKKICTEQSGTFDPCAVQQNEGKNVCTDELVREFSPDGKSSLSFSVNEKGSDFRRQRFEVAFKDQTHVELNSPAAPQEKETDNARSINAPTGATMVNFQLTWFDFPLTDNSLLASGARFSIFVDRVCEKSPDAEEADAVRLGLLWFPQDYYPARERPTNYRQIREKLGLVMKN